MYKCIFDGVTVTLFFFLITNKFYIYNNEVVINNEPMYTVIYVRRPWPWYRLQLKPTWAGRQRRGSTAQRPYVYAGLQGAAVNCRPSYCYCSSLIRYAWSSQQFLVAYCSLAGSCSQPEPSRLDLSGFSDAGRLLCSFILHAITCS